MAIGSLSGECLIIDINKDFDSVEKFRVQNDEHFCNCVSLFTDSYYNEKDY
jgi:hypothetical protein